jgi:hypothetical protein
MGIRIHTTLIYGIQFTNKESRAFEAFMKGKPRDWFLMRLIEEHLKQDWERRKQNPKKRFPYDIYFTNDFVKRSKKTRMPLKPYRPFWTGMSKKQMAEVEEDLNQSTYDYLKSVGCASDAQAFKTRSFIQWPTSHPEYEPKNLLGYIGENNYAREVDYAMIELFEIGQQNKTYVIDGKRPWECGTDYHKASKSWGTFNGQNMIPDHLLPRNKREELLHKIEFQQGGTRNQFIATKKAVWDEYHGHLRPYKIYYGDGWGGTSFYFYPIDMLYKLISEHIPSIKYDVMRLEKFLCFYWG